MVENSPNSPSVLNINLFANEGEGCESTIKTDDGKIFTVTPTEFIQGWGGRRPPFGNSNVQIREAVSVGSYEAAGWANDEVRARWSDPTGARQSVVVERREKPVQRPGDAEPPFDAERKRTTYLNVRIKVREDNRF